MFIVHGQFGYGLGMRKIKSQLILIRYWDFGACIESHLHSSMIFYWSQRDASRPNCNYREKHKTIMRGENIWWHEGIAWAYKYLLARLRSQENLPILRDRLTLKLYHLNTPLYTLSFPVVTIYRTIFRRLIAIRRTGWAAGGTPVTSAPSRPSFLFVFGVHGISATAWAGMSIIVAWARWMLTHCK